MEHDVKKYFKYKRGIVFMLSASGVWPNYTSHPAAVRLFLNICSALASGCMFYCIVNFCLNYATNINAFTSCLGLMIGFFSTFIKVIILPMQKEDLQSLNEGVSASYERNLRIVKFRHHLLAHFPMFSRFFYLYSYSVGMSVLLLTIMPLLALRQGKYVRMYPQLVPFSYEPGGSLHWSIYAFEVFCGFYLWSVTSGVDSVFGLYALHMVGELRLLNVRFQMLKSSNNYAKDLKSCVDSHIMLMESRHKLQRIFGFLAIWLAITCAIALCALVFQALQAKHATIIRIIYLCGHCFLKLLQAYFYAWYGNIIAIESDACQSAIYESQWPGSGDKRFMNDVLVVLSQTPMIFKAKQWMPLRLDMFS
ncbi:odorant receptor 246 isoform X1 [Nasonia vitripennis]|nr:odorant receptor 246 isoform X1 [Nasonia vitripennis]